MKKVRVNITTLANNSNIRREMRAGREVIVVPSYTLPDNIVMNGIRYPAEEIAKSYMTLDRTPAPFDHPMVNGEWVSASDPVGLNLGYIGAWNENPRQDAGRVYLEKVIDVEVANRSENGRSVIAAIDAGDPIHTSTGLIAALNELENSEDGADYEAYDLLFDHDAILLNAIGAATPEQGVGMLVNGEMMKVVNSTYSDELDEQMSWQLQSLMRTVEEQSRLPMMERLKQMIVEAFSAPMQNTNPEENAEMANEKELAALATGLTNLDAKIDTMVSSITDALTTAMTAAMQPVADTMAEISNAAKARDDAKKEALVNSVVKAEILSKELAETMSVEALEGLVNKISPKGSKNALTNFGTEEATDEFADYDFNKLELVKGDA